MLDPHIAFVTGEPILPGYSRFPALSSYDAGGVEMLVREVDVDPDRLRAKLKLKGSRQMAVVVVWVGDNAVAHICGARQR